MVYDRTNVREPAPLAKKTEQQVTDRSSPRIADHGRHSMSNNSLTNGIGGTGFNGGSNETNLSRKENRYSADTADRVANDSPDGIGSGTLPHRHWAAVAICPVDYELAISVVRILGKWAVIGTGDAVEIGVGDACISWVAMDTQSVSILLAAD